MAQEEWQSDRYSELEQLGWDMQMDVLPKPEDPKPLRLLDHEDLECKQLVNGDATGVIELETDITVDLTEVR